MLIMCYLHWALNRTYLFNFSSVLFKVYLSLFLHFYPFLSPYLSFFLLFALFTFLLLHISFFFYSSYLSFFCNMFILPTMFNSFKPMHSWNKDGIISHFNTWQGNTFSDGINFKMPIISSQETNKLSTSRVSLPSSWYTAFLQNDNYWDGYFKRNE